MLLFTTGVCIISPTITYLHLIKNRSMEKREGKILIVDDNRELLLALKMFLGKWFAEVKTISNPNQLNSLLREEWFNLILLDMNFAAGVNTGNEGFYWLKRILEQEPDASVILITAYADIELAVRAMKEGALDFISKTWDEEKMLQAVLSAFRQQETHQELNRVKNQQRHLAGCQATPSLIKGNSSSMRKVFDTVRKVANTEASVLLLGENGTGKEMIAREIHRLSPRNREMFVSVDLGALPETLFESEMFGYNKGAFTDAKDEKAGRMEIASGGSLFLDELGNLPLAQQAKLLAAVQNGEITRLGATRAKKVDIRIIAATNMPLYQMVEEGTFRRDLLYRLNTIQIDIPPLRERKEDIPILASAFVVEMATKYKKQGICLSEAALEKLIGFHWPGNVRELQHIIEKATILCDTTTIGADDINFTERYLKNSAAGSLNLEENEKFLVEQAIEKSHGNMSLAARKLGINRTTLYQKVKRYEL